uniref:Card1-like endonuclease domain-containing protein n=1 Tax=Clostridium disporicum TaxID=84024 RepID=UPI0034A4B587
INSLALLELSIKNNIKAIYTDVKNKKIYTFNNGIDLTYEEFDDLDIKDIINAAGGELAEDSSELCNKKDLIYLSEQIYKHLDIWNKHKQKLYDTNIFKHIEEAPNKIEINIKLLTQEEKVLLNNILKKLEDMNELQYTEKNENIEVTFLNKYIKGFMFKSGTWLEIATNNLIKKIKEIDEARNGVVFLWSNENRIVRNEVDVVAVKDSVPIVISCKDSEKYNEMALNELNVYANKIGGKNAYKILVATREPCKGPVSIRAKEMGIHIVIFDGDENKFIKNIKAIIDK